jgi:8-oxo-dGTP pyrophosphatase MutT (NUDIX family)
MHKAYIDKLAFICIKDRRLLVSLSLGKDTWYIPGGKREPGESDLDALIREVREELDVNLLLDTVVHYGTFEAQAHGKPEGTLVRMTCYTADFTGSLKPANEIEKIAYFTYDDRHKASTVDHLIFNDLRAKNLVD